MRKKLPERKDRMIIGKVGKELKTSFDTWLFKQAIAQQFNVRSIDVEIMGTRPWVPGRIFKKRGSQEVLLYIHYPTPEEEKEILFNVAIHDTRDVGGDVTIKILDVPDHEVAYDMNALHTLIDLFEKDVDSVYTHNFMTLIIYSAGKLEEYLKKYPEYPYDQVISL